MKKTNLYIARILGLLLIICSIILLIVNPKNEHNLPSGFFTPIVAFEFIQTPQEVQHFFEVKNTETYHKSMLLGNSIDYAFMFIYSSFLFCIAILIKSISKSKTMWIALFFCIIMLLADMLENFQIFNITQFHLIQPFDKNLSLLALFTWIKWSSISAVFLLFTPFFFKGKFVHKLIAFCCICNFIFCISAYLQHGILNEFLALSVAVVFLCFILFVFTFKPTTKLQ